MTISPSPQRKNDNRRGLTAPLRQEDDLEALRDENDRLRGLVVQLSELVMRNAASRQ